ncbi:hypothetical protein PLUA15_120076 [Pseudomonas lundensis]|uniref:Uncharacterized protein n=1 Tax=Pseudomonas lundensis TaxID=86185 RepID=A0AAX2H2G6_9PSED|nr:hypothetical protein PLUA15_120076 [Pseudomonas lundensis]
MSKRAEQQGSSEVSDNVRGALDCLTAKPIRGCRLYFNNRQNVFRRFFGLKSPPPLTGQDI